MTDSQRFTSYEACLINNLSIGTVEEAFALMPSLTDKFPSETDLETIFNRLQDFQQKDDSALDTERTVLTSSHLKGGGGDVDMSDMESMASSAQSPNYSPTSHTLSSPGSIGDADGDGDTPMVDVD